MDEFINDEGSPASNEDKSIERARHVMHLWGQCRGVTGNPRGEGHGQADGTRDKEVRWKKKKYGLQ